MKKGDTFEGVVERVDFPNKGRVRVDDQTITVKNAIPGQTIRGMINKKRGGRMEARLLEVVRTSPLEKRDPLCSNFPACGGCMYQTMLYEDQLQMKEAQLYSLLDEAIRTAGQTEDYAFEGIHPSPEETAYRNKMEFSFGDTYKDGPLALGLHKKGSTYDILTTDDCVIVHNDFNIILRCVLDYFTEHPAPYYKKMQHTGYLRHLLLRRSHTSGNLLINLVTTSQEQHDLAPLVERLLALENAGGSAVTGDSVDGDIAGDAVASECSSKSEVYSKGYLQGHIAGILHITNDSLADVVQSDRTEVLYGQDYIEETILGLRFKITPFSFFQTNSAGAEVLYSVARDYIGNTKDQIVYDLYSGTGTIAQMMASVAKEVVGVEIVEEAVAAAKMNAALNGLDNCTFLAGDVLKVLDDIEVRPDMIVLDPPRDGIHPKALKKIIDYGVEKMVYISCKPTSLARDLQSLIGSGYRVEKMALVDMFVGTVHVETVVLMSRKDK